ncbi:hypothetical protein ACFL1H_00250 [Nanoarchaeota archaeon]
MKKGQASQMFVYAISIIIVGLVFVFGYMAVSALLDTGDKAAKNKLLNDVEKDFENIKSGYDSFIKKYKVYKGVEEICFVDKGITSPNGDYNDYVEISSSDDDSNVFFIVNGRVDETLIVDTRISNATKSRAVCFDTSSGVLEIEITGFGRSVTLSQPKGFECRIDADCKAEWGDNAECRDKFCYA